jgi:hypothetical protein
MEGIEVDFRCFLSFKWYVPDFRAYEIDLSEFEKRRFLTECNEMLCENYERFEDGFLIFIKSMKISNCFESHKFEKALENVMNLHHPCIIFPIGFVFPTKGYSLQELNIAGLCFESGSLSEILSENPD